MAASLLEVRDEVCLGISGSRIVGGKEAAKMLNDEYIWLVWEWCSDAYLRHGRRLKFPADTDPKKTYQWRYVAAVARKFIDWEFDEATAKRFIEIAIDRAQAAGVGQKGLAALHQGNLLQAAYKRLKEESSANDSRLASLAIVRRFLSGLTTDNVALVQRLLVKRDADALPNLVLWVQSNRITPLYLSLSRACNVAMKRLNQDERLLLPKATTLFTIRSDFTRDLSNERQARQLLGSDWRELCQLRRVH